MFGIVLDGTVVAEFAAPLSFISNQPTSSADGLSLKRSAHESPAQRWELTASLMPKTWDANELFALFVKNGRRVPYRIAVPQNTGVIAGTTSRSMIHTARGSVNSVNLTLSEWTGTLPAGALITFEGHNKLYMLARTLKTGATSMEVYPPLRKAVSDQSFKFKNVQIDMLLDTEGVRGMKYVDGILMDLGALTFVENI